MSLARRLWNLARALLRGKPSAWASDPEPPSVEDLRAQIRVRQVVDDALADLAGWRLESHGESADTVIRNGQVTVTWDWVWECWQHPAIGGIQVDYMPRKHKFRKAMNAAIAADNARRVRAAAEKIGGAL
jgi:hypothetical protein